MQSAEEKGFKISKPSLFNTLQRYLADIVYGATDGIITTFTIISGIEGAKLSPVTAIILGIVNLFADGLSMAASSYLSSRANTAVNSLTHSYKEPCLHAGVTFTAFVCFGGIPMLSFLLPYFSEHRFFLSCIMSAVALACVGILRSFVAKEPWWKNALEMVAIGGMAAIIAYVLGSTLAKHLMTQT